MKTISIYLVITLWMGATLSSCVNVSGSLSSRGIEKRRYMPGYHLDLLQKKNSLMQAAFQQGLPENECRRTEDRIVSQGSQKRINGLPIDRVEAALSHAVIIHSDSTPCDDLITFRNGDKVAAKVISVGIAVITYKKCAYLSGPAYVVDKSSVRTIRYRNGEVEQFEQAEEAYYTRPERSRSVAVSPVEGSSVASLVLGILSVLGMGWGGAILGIIAIVLGSNALKKLNNNTEGIRGRGMALAGIILGVVSIVFTLLIISILLLYFFSLF